MQSTTPRRKKFPPTLSFTVATLFVLTLSSYADARLNGDADTDGDGLTNAQERTLRTNPRKADTDKDGLSDWEEVMETLTNPKRRDSDRDHLTDTQELILHTDPLDEDTDDDGVEDGDEIEDGTDPNDADTDDDGIDDGDDQDPGEHGAEFELRGLVTAADSSAGCLLTVALDTGSVQVDASAATLSGAASCAALQGQLVEIEGEVVNGVFHAEKVQVEDDPAVNEVEIRGQVTAVDGCLLTVATQTGPVQVDASVATLRGAATCADLVGQLVEAEGEMSNNVLLAKKVSVEDD